tara:strand:- start:632 stop:832 length:201 start_codon:yes stop_codon:yes gene_type:complete
MGAPACATDREWRTVRWTPARHGECGVVQRRAILLLVLHTRWRSDGIGVLDPSLLLHVLGLVDVSV